MTKRMKKRGMRKAYLKRFSAEYINTGHSPGNALDKKSTAARCTPFFRYGRDSLSVSPFLEAPNPRIGLDDPKLAIELRLEEQQKMMQGPYLQRLHTFQYIYLWKAGMTSMRMYFSGNEAFFVEENRLAKQVKRSIIYQGRELAMLRFKRKKITWVETVSTANAE